MVKDCFKIGQQKLNISQK